MTLTLHIPEDLAEKLRVSAATEGMDLKDYVVAALEDILAEDKERKEVIAAIEQAISDYENGDRGRPIEEFWAELDAKYGPVPSSIPKLSNS
jgi:plasmid stability protein